MDQRLRALNRFGLGARPGERAGLSDVRGWLRQQLRSEAAVLDEPGLPTQQEASDAIYERQRRQRERARSGETDQRERNADMRPDGVFGMMAIEHQALLDRRLTTDSPYLERLVAFWSNHLCVSPAGKGRLATFPGLYERQAIRPHVLGRYSEMVLASAQHPAMLLYLDNMQSIGPNSDAAHRAARFNSERERGLNENYARELLELHTLGVDGGYDQQDVEQLARVLTGWTLQGLPMAEMARERAMADGNRGLGARFRDRMRESALRSAGYSSSVPFGFAFRSELHEPGSKTVLGKRYREGQSAGREVIADLCAHPATAHHVATKLVRHFVADEPPARAVNEIAAVFQDTDGDLLRVSQALIDQPEAWSGDNLKFRTPQDWLVAAGRALGVESLPRRASVVLRELRHPIWSPPSPKGYDDIMGPWADPDSLMNRAELSRTVADSVGSRVDPARLMEVTDAAADGALAGLLADRSIGRNDRLALAIGGPDFQWR